MKTIGNLLSLKRTLLSVLILFSFVSAYSQPDYIFKGAVLESGTDLLPGAVYRFSDVKNNTDALVEIKGFSGGVTLNAIDETWTGFDEAFQPFIDCAAGADGYVEFKITFVAKGTTNPKNQGQVPVTPIDVDAGQSGKILEQDIVDMGSGSNVDYDFLNTEVGVVNIGGDKFWGKNFAGIGYSGVDTAAKVAMFTVTNNSISSLTVKVGADNTNGDQEIRYRSIYFKKFNYNNPGLLPLPYLLSFSGVSKSSSIDLKWELGKDNNAGKIILERSFSGRDFTTLAEIQTIQGNSKTQYNYSDPKTSAAVVYYRLKTVGINGKTEYSNILYFRKNTVQNDKTIKVYPTVVTGGQFSVALNAEERQESLLQMLDYSGRIVYQKKMQLQEGTNTFLISDFSSSLKGNYVVVTKTANRTETSKILIH